MLQLHPGVIHRELPVNPLLEAVPSDIPCGRLLLESLHGIDPTIEALSGEHRKLHLRDVQPGAMLRGVVEFDPLHDPSRLRRAERLVQGGEVVRVQIVADEDYPFGIRIVLIDEPSYLECPFDSPAPPRHRHTTPSSERLGEHERTACAASDVFMVDLLRVVALRKTYRPP